MTRLLTLLALSLLTSFGLLAQETPELTALQTRMRDGEVRFIGQARLVHQGNLLTADEIAYRQADGFAVATGNVVLTRGSQRLLARELTYNLETASYEVAHFRFGQFPVLVTGSTASGSAEGSRFQNLSLAYGEPGFLTPTFTTPSASLLDDEGTVRVSSGRLGLGQADFGLPLPSFTENLAAPDQGRWEIGAGFRSSLGAYLEIGLQLPVADGFRAGADLGLYTNRGLMIGPAATYNTLDSDGLGLRGSFRSGYISDSDRRGLDLLGRPIDSDRAFVTWQHHQRLSPSLTLAGQLNYWSDSEIIRDFHSGRFRNLQTPDNWFEATHTGQNYIVSAFSRFQPNRFSIAGERLPEVRFDGLPVALGAGFYHRLNASAALLREETPVAAAPNPVVRSTRADAHYSLSRPISPREWMSLTPVAGGRLTHYDRATGGRNHYTRLLGELGLDAEIRISGHYGVENQTWKINGLRHLLTPRLSYRYIPSADSGRPFIPVIDGQQAFSTYLQPLGLGNRRDIDFLSPVNTVRLGLDNILQTRDPLYGSRDLIALQLAADFHFDDQPGRRSTSDLHAAFALTPAPWLRFDLYQRYTPQTGNLAELNTGLTFRDADLWSLRLSSHYLDAPASPLGSLQEYVLDYAYRLNEIHRLLASLRYDSRNSRFVEQSYALEHKLTQLWTLLYVLSIYDGPRRESDLGFSVRVNLTSF